MGLGPADLQHESEDNLVGHTLDAKTRPGW
jgi:hypothetical protein